MTSRIRKALIVFCSPAGSTAHVAQVIKQKIQLLETPMTVIDLGDEPDIGFIIPQLMDAKDNINLFIGSPVYAAHPVPPVMEFIGRLPQAEKGYSVPFITYGGVSSGVALYEMAAALEAKGYAVLGAAKIPAKHSMMWQSDIPLGHSHPDTDDDRLTGALLDTVNAKLQLENPPSLSISVLDYQPTERGARMKSRSFHEAKTGFPQKRFLEERCTRCGICLQKCPVEAITLKSVLEFSPVCISCYSCVRLCPEGAIVANLESAWERLRTLAAQISEQPAAQIFI